MNPVLFGTVLTAELLLIIVVIVSMVFPRSRVWPPPRKDSWQHWLSWALFAVSMFGVPIVGVLDFESLGQSHWSRFLIGGLAIFIGLGIDMWGTRTLTAQQSLGAKGMIVTGGPYRFTRNPQYVGFILIYAGIVLAAYSFWALVTGVVLIIAFLILPLSEEPWLLKEYGEEYLEYCKRVPRFVGIRSLRRASKNQ